MRHRLRIHLYLACLKMISHFQTSHFLRIARTEYYTCFYHLCNFISIFRSVWMPCPNSEGGSYAMTEIFSELLYFHSGYKILNYCKFSCLICFFKNSFIRLIKILSSLNVRLLRSLQVPLSARHKFLLYMHLDQKEKCPALRALLED